MKKNEKPMSQKEIIKTIGIIDNKCVDNRHNIDALQSRISLLKRELDHTMKTVTIFEVLVILVMAGLVISNLFKKDEECTCHITPDNIKTVIIDD